jgi:hypothetical protein
MCSVSSSGKSVVVVVLFWRHRRWCWCVFSFTPDLKIVFCFLVLLDVSVVLFMVVTDLVWWYCGDARDSGGGSVLAGPLWFGIGFNEFVSLLENCLFQTEFSDGLDFV